MKVTRSWVKKEVPYREWENYYSKNSSYCVLSPGKEVIIGFLVAKEIPNDCEECDYYELRQMDNYRRATNIMPFPLEKEEPQESLEDYDNRKEALKELQKAKEDLKIRNIL